MSDFFKAITDHQLGVQGRLLNSFGFGTETNSIDEIQKSHIIRDFDSQQQFTIDKPGKLIKEKLRKMLEDERTENSTYLTNLAIVRSQIDEDPSGDAKRMYYYRIDGFEDKIGLIPGEPYSYEQFTGNSIDEKKSSPQNVNIDTVQYKEDCSCKKKSDYNKFLEGWIDSKVEIAMLETMINNLEDNKVYKLSVGQATMMGF